MNTIVIIAIIKHLVDQAWIAATGSGVACVAIATVVVPELVIIGLSAGIVVAINYEAEYAKTAIFDKKKKYYPSINSISSIYE